MNVPSQQSNIRALRGKLDRFRRSARQTILEPILLSMRSLREPLFNALARRNHLIYCRLPDASFFVDPTDRVVGAWLTWHGGWQREEIEQAVSVLADSRGGGGRPNAVFVDVGANIGTQTVYAMLTGHFSRGIAFEPEPRNAELLEMNVAANKLTDRVEVVRTAIGAREEMATLHLHPRNKGAHALGCAPSLDGTDSVPVPVMRLDQALASREIGPKDVGLIWIDVEGSESDVVQGLGDYLGHAPLAIEYAPERFAAGEGAQFVDLLQRHYRTLHRLGSDNRGAEPISHLRDIIGMTDILLT